MDSLVKQIYDFFKGNLCREQTIKKRTLNDFLCTLDGYILEQHNGAMRTNGQLERFVYGICNKMAADGILICTKDSKMAPLFAEYLSVSEKSFVDPDMFNLYLNRGLYDNKYMGFPYIRNAMGEAVIPIVGINKLGDEDMGSTYYIGEGRFVTAAHCVEGLEKFKLLGPEDKTIPINEVWFTSAGNTDTFDLAILITDEEISLEHFLLADPNVLEEVMVMGYPQIPGIHPIVISEKASVGSYVQATSQTTAVGQVVSDATSYMSELDYFIINARVKGGNSGGPVINEWGQVIGTVFELPFDSQGGSNTGRYDIMGFGICLPSKYTEHLITNHVSRETIEKNGYYVMKNEG